MTDPNTNEDELDDATLEAVAGGDHDGGTPLDFPSLPETYRY